MKILYGIQGTGNGHITRSLALVPLLRSSGNNVKVIISGREKSKLFGVEELMPYEVYRGLTFKTANGKINKISTLFHSKPFHFIADVLKINLKEIDLVITDFEPITAWASKLRGIKSLGIGHQYAFIHDIPLAGKNILSEAILKYFAPADYNIGLHWHHFNQNIFPPILPSHKYVNDCQNEKKILVYLPFEELGEIIKILKPFKNHQFCIYHNVSKKIKDENMTIKPFSRTGFDKDFLLSKKVFCNAGFELPSESLILGKSLLVKPLVGQIEQESNAAAINQLGLGVVMDSLDRKIIGKWIDSTNKKPINYPDIAQEIVDLINSMRFDDIEHFSRKIWKKVNI
ncbi:MAG: MJ1255/VC2487 family glycosyltransferase [Candidatus Neomarinimicrobiota bacterium]